MVAAAAVLGFLAEDGAAAVSAGRLAEPDAPTVTSLDRLALIPRRSRALVVPNKQAVRKAKVRGTKPPGFLRLSKSAQPHVLALGFISLYSHHTHQRSDANIVNIVTWT